MRRGETKSSAALPKLVAAVATGQSVTDAARAAGASRATAYRLLDSDDGKAAIAELRAAALQYAATRHAALLERATDAAVAVLDDPDAPAMARLTAYRLLTANAAALRESTDHEERIAVLEAVARRRTDRPARLSGRLAAVPAP